MLCVFLLFKTFSESELRNIKLRHSRSSAPFNMCAVASNSDCYCEQQVQCSAPVGLVTNTQTSRSPPHHGRLPAILTLLLSCICLSTHMNTANVIYDVLVSS